MDSIPIQSLLNEKSTDCSSNNSTNAKENDSFNEIKPHSSTDRSSIQNADNFVQSGSKLADNASNKSNKDMQSSLNANDKNILENNELEESKDSLNDVVEKRKNFPEINITSELKEKEYNLEKNGNVQDAVDKLKDSGESNANVELKEIIEPKPTNLSKTDSDSKSQITVQDTELKNPTENMIEKEKDLAENGSVIQVL